MLVRLTELEAALIARGAKKAGLKPIPFLRESALYNAREYLGLRQP